MPPAVVNLVIAGLILFMTYALTSEGLWGSALMCFNVMFAGIIAFNFYEPLAKLLADNLGFISWHADSICLMTLFIASVVVLRLTTETLGPSLVRYPSALYQVGRLFFGFSASVMTVAIILLAFETSSVHKKVFYNVDYKFKPPFGFGIDHEWLAFFQWTTGQIFPSYGAGRDWMGEYGTAKVFDPKGEWLLNHQEARPFGTESILGGDEPAAEAAPAEGAGGAAPKAAGADAGRRKPGDPQIIGSGATGVVAP